MIGVTFAPTADGLDENRGKARLMPWQAQQAIQAISLQLPRVLGARSVAPRRLLAGPGVSGVPTQAGQSAENAIQALLRGSRTNMQPVATAERAGGYAPRSQPPSQPQGQPPPLPDVPWGIPGPSVAVEDPHVDTGPPQIKTQRPTQDAWEAREPVGFAGASPQGGLPPTAQPPIAQPPDRMPKPDGPRSHDSGNLPSIMDLLRSLSSQGRSF